MVDARCPECRDIGCECPKGYVSDPMQCDVCGFRFVLVAACCVAHNVTCIRCDGHISLVDPDNLQ